MRLKTLFISYKDSLKFMKYKGASGNFINGNLFSYMTILDTRFVIGLILLLLLFGFMSKF